MNILENNGRFVSLSGKSEPRKEIKEKKKDRPKLETLDLDTIFRKTNVSQPLNNLDIFRKTVNNLSEKGYKIDEARKISKELIKKYEKNPEVLMNVTADVMSSKILA